MGLVCSYQFTGIVPDDFQYFLQSLTTSMSNATLVYPYTSSMEVISYQSSVEKLFTLHLHPCNQGTCTSMYIVAFELTLLNHLSPFDFTE